MWRTEKNEWYVDATMTNNEHDSKVSSCSSSTLNHISTLIVQKPLCASWMKVRQLCAHQIKQ